MQPKITICIPTYNSERTIKETLESAFSQTYPLKEILVIDDASTDKTVDIVKEFPVKLIVNEKNLGIGKNLEKLMKESTTPYVIYLSSDDLFTHKHVVTDVVQIFNKCQEVGVIGRYYYYFLNGFPGAIGVCRENRILINACCPSGMAFRRDPTIVGTNKIFVEMPSIVAQYLKNWYWTIMEYDTIAARFLPGNNTGTKSEYYTESPLQNWIDLMGYFKDYPSFIMLKNRAPHLLIPEIKLAMRTDKTVKSDWAFWLYAGAALILPGWFLRRFTVWYRHNIGRRSAKIIERGANV